MAKTAIRIIACLLTLTGCIKSEEPNIEVDILEVLTSNEGVLTVVQQGSTIDVYVVPTLDISDLTLDFVLSEGAAITPDPATVTDYSSARVFRVTSEDKMWTKDYTVSVTLNEIPTSFGFEHWFQPERMRYKIPVEQLGNVAGEAEMHIWASGNEAYNFLTNKFDDHTVFPTQPTTEAHSGDYAVKLITKTTPELSKPIAAGNLFIGQFDASLLEPRESTMFGLPFYKKPVRFHGWYKYRSGGLTQYSKEADNCKLQAVLYKTDGTVKHLNGFTIKTSANIVARAYLSGGDTATDGYVEFDVPFEYTEDIDIQKMKGGGYNLAVIFSSSLNGDVYDGAPGSTLLVDDVEIICDELTGK